jgi:hypothetical protein
MALSIRSRFRFYDSSSLEEGPPIPLRPISGDRFAFGESALGFVNPASDGRMDYLAMAGRLLKRVA